MESAFDWFEIGRFCNRSSYSTNLPVLLDPWGGVQEPLPADFSSLKKSSEDGFNGSLDWSKLVSSWISEPIGLYIESSLNLSDSSDSTIGSGESFSSDITSILGSASASLASGSGRDVKLKWFFESSSGKSFWSKDFSHLLIYSGLWSKFEF